MNFLKNTMKNQPISKAATPSWRSMACASPGFFSPVQKSLHAAPKAVKISIGWDRIEQIFHGSRRKRGVFLTEMVDIALLIRGSCYDYTKEKNLFFFPRKNSCRKLHIRIRPTNVIKIAASNPCTLDDGFMIALITLILSVPYDAASSLLLSHPALTSHKRGVAFLWKCAQHQDNSLVAFQTAMFAHSINKRQNLYELYKDGKVLPVL